jgi:hypothetical protein
MDKMDNKNKSDKMDKPDKPDKVNKLKKMDGISKMKLMDFCNEKIMRKSVFIAFIVLLMTIFVVNSKNSYVHFFFFLQSVRFIYVIRFVYFFYVGSISKMKLNGTL